ncbi:MAG TPA: D-aminoacyl-tRNA deacylase [Sulfurihydrogenibium sp.]|uniref:D-aminoacyl-tRNA deacylase n=1 Tax=Sulfurihydrogenibium sp. (strain YO3AOP1) TaxID=436114 RepID=DTD_SULSY|nr:D-aminoacyl-tRNA deacylase [Sulfurihydrogenibium sp. YO3AOP1]B2V7S8.1 RecName: Full=D-aminoacyl-tRNA deacylase; Short=DTD; AltName: Full=Gly-tRNA(Ala) deacylase [Sulfurihydrogenibium sp. YO3AOP1]ACD66001.1 D-tyrosyl-tRNA(Tyr) deacylase [Sulfurihydrogenibium sp. YO3AOP1]HBT97985.1 D-aminoacyl-tRNA deacylase [Sulfurihydrogenibium sp.]
MIAVVQRVTKSSVEVDGKVVGEIRKGVNILLGVAEDDTEEDINKLVNKIVYLRMFEDEDKKMNYSLLDINGEALIISQFTLLANLKKGRRPSFEYAAKPDKAKALYEKFVEEFSKYVKVQTGIFGADMKVYILNDGPVTFILDSKQL